MNTCNALTGRSGRHNKALRDVIEWLETIQKFITEYDLQEEGSNLDSVLDNIGKVKFELTTIKYRASGIIKTASNIKGLKVPPLINEIADELDDFRRALINPALGHTILFKIIPELRNSLKNLQDAMSKLEYK